MGLIVSKMMAEPDFSESINFTMVYVAMALEMGTRMVS
jgi:hypothetical protein